MFLSENEFFNKYGNEYKSMLEEITFYVNNPDILKQKCSETKEKTVNGLPAPTADDFAYKLNLYKGLIRFPERLKNYITAKNQKLDSVVRHLPIILDIEPNSRCNFSCIMCQVRDWDNNKRANDINFDEFKKLVDEQYGLTEVKLLGIGEPLMHKQFFDMLDYLIEKNIWVRTTTNGSYLHKNDNYKKLVDSGIGEVQISFDGATKEVFEKIRINSNFEQIIDNVTMLNKYANSKNRLMSRMWILIQNSNSHQIKEFISIARKMEFKRITFSIGIGDWGQEQFRSDTLQVKSKSREEIITEVKNLIVQNKDLDITFWDLQESYNKDNICKWPFTRAFIGSDMRIAPCCMIGNPDIKDIGNAKNFTTVWNSKSYQDFRNSHLENKIPNYCMNCYK
ncbi:MAG: radical SAM/SPASM domain-containing protein [Candidatus Marinarcus sp.]|uniref:radical SAM protein n=1 Tax=Candidatus Marinarcus sp. TaxID=3100987 RepID=UPI003B001C6E